MKEGLEKSEIKLKRTLQDILNISPSDDAVFHGKSLLELQAITASLRNQIRKRT